MFSTCCCRSYYFLKRLFRYMSLLEKIIITTKTLHHSSTNCCFFTRTLHFNNNSYNLPYFLFYNCKSSSSFLFITFFIDLLINYFNFLCNLLIKFRELSPIHFLLELIFYSLLNATKLMQKFPNRFSNQILFFIRILIII